MNIICLPCEIHDREFDAKLLLAVRISSRGGLPVLIGYDKHFNNIVRTLDNPFLLDKSCSSIVYEGRISPAIERGAKVIVSDEEGFNNIHLLENTYKARVDPKAAACVSNMYCWGSIDFEFYSIIEELKNKLSVKGNCRADLLGNIGKAIYQNQVKSLNNLYGNYVLCSDNFAVEHWHSNYRLPKFTSTSKKTELLDAEQERYMKEKQNRREIFADYIEFLAKALPYTNFIIRPHPVARPNWWHKRFWKYRNIHITGLLSVEPWIHGCTCMISMGCTSSLQAIAASKPVIEIKDEKNQLVGLSQVFTQLVASSKNTLIDCFRTATSKKARDKELFKNLDLLKSYWHNYENSRTTIEFAKSIQLITHDLKHNNIGTELSKLDDYSLAVSRSEFYIDPCKWKSNSLDNIKEKIMNISNATCTEPPKIRKVSNGLFLISNE